MKHCRPGWKRRVVFVFLLLLLVPPIFFAPFQLIWGTELLPQERIYIILGIPLFIAVLVYLTLHVLYFGPMGIDYDDEKIVFHFSKKREKTYRWEQLKKEKVLLHRMGASCTFLFPDKKQYIINGTMTGYWELSAMLDQKGVFSTPNNIFTKPDGRLITKIFKIFLGGG